MTGNPQETSRNRAVVDGEETSQYPRSRRSPVDFLSSVNWAELGLKVLAALAILVVTAILATVLKSAVAKVSVKIPVLQRPGVDGAALGNSLGTIVSMAILSLCLIVILGNFQLSQILSPVTLMLEQSLSYVTIIVRAVFVFIIGLTIAKIARALIVTALNAVDFCKLMCTAQSGFQKATGGVTSVPGQTAPHGAQAQTAPQDQPGQQGQAGQQGHPVLQI